METMRVDQSIENLLNGPKRKYLAKHLVYGIGGLVLGCCLTTGISCLIFSIGKEKGTENNQIDVSGHRIKPGYPHSLANKRFIDTFGHSWIFGKQFSPYVVGQLMYIPIGHCDGFFAEYHFNFDGDNTQIIYECKKYEVAENLRINIWAFTKTYKTYNDSMPSLCDLCNGTVRLKTVLTDIESDLPVNSVSAPNLSDPKTPPYCDATR